jgi:hypothetical protein
MCRQGEKDAKGEMGGSATNIIQGCDVHVPLIVCIYINKSCV